MSDSKDLTEEEIIMIVHDTSFCKNHCKDYNACQNIMRDEDKIVAECVWRGESLLTEKLITNKL